MIEKYVKEHSMKYLPAALLLRDSQVYIEYVYVYTYTDTHSELKRQRTGVKRMSELPDI